jgi:hypothetical protein
MRVPHTAVERRSEEKMKLWEWYCDDCDEWVGWPEIGETTAQVCRDRETCVRSDQWGGDACGHVVCGDCRSVVSERVKVYDKEEVTVSI